MTGRKIWYSLVAAVAIGGAASAVHAATLQDLITAGVPVTYGNLTYSNFSATGLDPSQVAFYFTTSGAEVAFTGGWNTAYSPAINSTVSYDVTAATGNVINDAAASISGLITRNNGTVTVDEILSPGGENSMYYDSTTNGPQNANDDSTGDPSTIAVSNMITLAAPGATDYAAVSFLSNSFTTAPSTGGPIPEPMSLGLMVPALIGLAMRKRRTA